MKTTLIALLCSAVLGMTGYTSVSALPPVAPPKGAEIKRLKEQVAALQIKWRRAQESLRVSNEQVARDRGMADGKVPLGTMRDPMYHGLTGDGNPNPFKR